MLKAKVSTKGQVTLPKDVRDQLGIRPGTELEVTVDNQAVRLQKVESRWRRWEGALAGTEPNLLRELEEEHRREIDRDERRAKHWSEGP